MGKILAKCCKEEDEEQKTQPNEKKEDEEKKNSQIKEKEVLVENLDKSDIPLTARNHDKILKENVFNDPHKEVAMKEKLPLLTNEKVEEDHEIKDNTPFAQKSNNFQEIYKSPGKNNSKPGNSESLIQELREIQKSQLALIKSKQQWLPNTINEHVENEDKNKKITDIFNSSKKENEEPERPPKIEEKDEESDEN